MAVRILDAMAAQGFEEVQAIHDPASGLRALLAIHDTSIGPAFGGIRRHVYRDETEALNDCLRLARAMSHKCALAEVPGGGAKTVLLDDPETDAAAGYRALGDRIQAMRGRYYAGPDLGTSWRELEWVAERTSYVTRPGDDGPGDLAGATAAGVFAGMEAALVQLDGEVDWPARRVVVQGLGKVGVGVARRVLERGGHVAAVELKEDRAHAVAAEFDVELLDAGDEFDVPCDVFSPCALGGILHDLTIPRLQARSVAGGANNVLARSRHAQSLHERGVLLVPDVVINAGAVIRGASFHLTGQAADNTEIGSRIGAAAADILRRAADEDLAPSIVAIQEAERRIQARRDGAAGAPGALPGPPRS
jgi:leucine dehydrogenase